MGQTARPAENVTEIELRIQDADCLFIELSEEHQCQVQLEHIVHRTDDNLVEYFTVSGTTADDVRSAAGSSESVVDARLIREHDRGLLFQFVVTKKCMIATLADVDAVVRDLYAVNGEGHVIADVPCHVETERTLNEFMDRHPESELISCHESVRMSPGFSSDEFRSDVLDQLTDRQFQVLEVAYLSGYFEWPQESSATDCANALDIAQSTFSQHLSRGEQKVLASVFDGRGPHEL